MCNAAVLADMAGPCDPKPPLPNMLPMIDPTRPSSRDLATHVALLLVLTLATSACATGGLSDGAPVDDTTNNGGSTNNGDDGCPASACDLGQSICTGSDEVQTCQDDGAGCGVFRLAENCLGADVCMDGRCTTGCIDADGDGHGNGCANGPDCDDTDFDKHNGKLELCDNKDNDCDNEIDEDDACATDCSLQECEPGVRECATGTSIRECRADNNGCGAWSPSMDCGGTCTAGRCDGCVDNDDDQRGANCAFGPDCDDADGTIFANAPELCDDKDNDCDNQTDEGNVCEADCSNSPCLINDVECVDSARVRQCVDNGFGCGEWGPATACGSSCANGQCANCVDNDGDQHGVGCALGPDCNDGDDTIYNGAAERCDSKDNDCDNQIDEDFADLSNTCSSGIGACRRDGTRVCSAGGTTTVCNALAGASSTELCGDNIDNDCDNQTDEGFDALGQSCTDGVGDCMATGRFVCSTDRRQLACNATASNPTTEVCDGRDNNCNNQVDEGGICDICVDDPLGENDSSSAAVATPLPAGTTLADSHCGAGGSSDRDWFNLGNFNVGQSFTVDLQVLDPGCSLHLEVYVVADFAEATVRTSSTLTFTHTVVFSGDQKLWVFPDANANSNCPYRVTHR